MDMVYIYSQLSVNGRSFLSGNVTFLLIQHIVLLTMHLCLWLCMILLY